MRGLYAEHGIEMAIEAVSPERLGLNLPLMPHLRLREPKDYCVLAHLSFAFKSFTLCRDIAAGNLPQ